jgi:hypothetical protein
LAVFLQNSHQVVILRACNFFDLFVFSASNQLYFKPPDRAVILSEALRRSIANRGLYARSRRTSAMLVGRCSWELSGRKLHRKIKKSQTLSGAPHRFIAGHSA